MIRFAEPAWLLLLLALLPFTWLLARRLRLVAPGRRALIIALRTVLLLLLVMALARAEWRRTSNTLAVFFLLDQSDSVPAEQQKEQLARLSELTRRQGPDDQVGVIVFGEHPSIETSPVRRYEFEGSILSTVPGTRTDIGAALRLALAAFPGGSMKRIVLLSDGNENAGSALEVARFARNSNVPIDAIPTNYDARNDIRVAKVDVPQRTAKDAPFDVKIHLEAEQETPAVLRLYGDNQLLLEQRVQVRPGRNPPFVVPQRLTEGGFHTFEAVVEAPGDLRPQNNRALAFTYLRAEPRILLIEGGELDSIAYLAAALRVENIRADIGTPREIPVSIESLQRYDALVLSNVAADMMSLSQMQMIERGVHDLGIGLVMIGGENSFGAGGYTDTPIEKALPVSMDIKQKKMMPNGALVIILHTCEIPNGNAWAREISLAALNVLSAQDYFGLLYFGMAPGAGPVGGGWGEFWLWNPGLQMTGNKVAMRTAIKGVQPLDMQVFDPTLKMAAEGLLNVKATTKHIVVISDGDPSPPSKEVVAQIRNNGITVSGVAIAPHSGLTVDTLKQMAYWGGGNFYYPKSPSELPRIFTKEATIVRKSLIREETFTPRGDAPSEVLMGLDGLPALNGYVVTSIKDLATQALVTEWDDPLLAHWRYGLGKTIAFTSDAKNRWATKWVGWGSFSKFWSQAIRWSLRETNSPNYQVSTELVGGKGRVIIDAVDEQGNFLNFLDFKGTVIGPDFQPQPIDLRQFAPGRYEATFPASQVGTYMIAMQTGSGEGQQFLSAGTALSYSPEYETSRSSPEFLRHVAEASGGRLVEDVTAYNPFRRDLLPDRQPEPLWPLFLLLAALLLPADIFVRRVYISREDAVKYIQAALGRVLPRRETREQYAERMETLRAAKARAGAERQEDEERRAAREAFRDRVARQQPPADGAARPDVFADSQTAAPPRPAAGGKHTVTPQEPTRPAPQQPGGAMGSLLEAKKRAQDRNRKP